MLEKERKYEVTSPPLRQAKEYTDQIHMLQTTVIKSLVSKVYGLMEIIDLTFSENTCVLDPTSGFMKCTCVENLISSSDPFSVFGHA